jgi:hypothetical protein
MDFNGLFGCRARRRLDRRAHEITWHDHFFVGDSGKVSPLLGFSLNRCDFVYQTSSETLGRVTAYGGCFAGDKGKVGGAYSW